LSLRYASEDGFVQIFPVVLALVACIKCVYKVDQPKCPKVSGEIRIVLFIDEAAAIRKISKHYMLWKEQAPRLPPEERPPPQVEEPMLDYGLLSLRFLNVR
jgi:hypothetical protein